MGGATVGRDIGIALAHEGIRHFANDNIAEAVSRAKLEAIETEVAYHVYKLLEALVIDQDNDHNTMGTAERVARMLVRETFAGRFQPMPKVTTFPNVAGVENIYTVGPVTVRSTCAHHLAPIVGRAWIGLIPSDRIIGLSKFARLTDWIMARPQIQEEATVQLANVIEEAVAPRALGVTVVARHLCMTWRGVREHDTEMVTTILRGQFLTDAGARQEYHNLIAATRGTP